VSFQRLLNFVGRNAGNVAKAVAPGSLLAGGFGLLESPQAALVYGAADFAGSFPATLAARAVGSKIKKPILGIAPKYVQGGIENVANIGASLGTASAASRLLYGDQAVTPTVMSQEQQLMQEMMQRAELNNLSVQAVAPGTQFQTAGLEFLGDPTRQIELAGNWQQYLGPYEQTLLAQASAGGMP
jgi:hypothetical protein